MSVNEIVLKERDTLRKTKTNEAQRRKQAESMADVQGSALRLGSIPGAPLYEKINQIGRWWCE